VHLLRENTVILCSLLNLVLASDLRWYGGVLCENVVVFLDIRLLDRRFYTVFSIHSKT